MNGYLDFQQFVVADIFRYKGVMSCLTWNTLVACLQVGLEFFETGSCAFELCIRHSNLAHSFTGAPSIGRQEDIGEAADVAEVDFDAPANLQASIECLLQYDHFSIGAFGPENLRVAIVATVDS